MFPLPSKPCSFSTDPWKCLPICWKKREQRELQTKRKTASLPQWGRKWVLACPQRPLPSNEEECSAINHECPRLPSSPILAGIQVIPLFFPHQPLTDFKFQPQVQSNQWPLTIRPCYQPIRRRGQRKMEKRVGERAIFPCTIQRIGFWETQLEGVVVLKWPQVWQISVSWEW